MKTILMIDDEKKFLDTYSRILTRKGFNVDTCTDSEKALNMANNNYYDLIC